MAQKSAYLRKNHRHVIVILQGRVICQGKEHIMAETRVCPNPHCACKNCTCDPCLCAPGKPCDCDACN